MKRINKKEIIKKLKAHFYSNITQEFKKLEGQVCSEIVNIHIQGLLEQTLGLCEGLSIQIETIIRNRRQKENVRCPFTMRLKGLEASNLRLKEEHKSIN